jgi:hypothetical protein
MQTRLTLQVVAHLDRAQEREWVWRSQWSRTVRLCGFASSRSS